MKLTVASSEAGVTCVDCEGDITQSDLWEEANPLEKLLGADAYAGKVLVNLARAIYIDSAGVGFFIGCHEKFTKAGGMLVLYSIPPMVNHIFQLLQMHTVLHLAKEEADARAMLLGGRP